MDEVTRKTLEESGALQPGDVVVLMRFRKKDGRWACGVGGSSCVVDDDSLTKAVVNSVRGLLVGRGLLDNCEPLS